MKKRGSKYEPQMAGSSTWDSTSVTEERNSGRKARTAERSSWELKLWVQSALKQDLLLVDSLWPACAGYFWEYLTIRDIFSDYRVWLESPAGVRTVVPFSSLYGLTTFLNGSMLPGKRRGLLSTGTFAWLLQLDAKLFSVYRCDLRFYDRFVDHAEDFEWLEVSLSEQEEAEITFLMQAPRSILSDKLWPMAEKVLELLETTVQEEVFERLMVLEGDGMRDFFMEERTILLERLRELFPNSVLGK